LFGTCSYKPIPKDLPSSSIQHRALASTFLTQPRTDPYVRFNAYGSYLGFWRQSEPEDRDAEPEGKESSGPAAG